MEAGQIVLVDTNVIIEAHETKCWTALTGFFACHAVEKIVEETQTGYQRRSPDRHIDVQALRRSLAYVATITEEDRAAFNMHHGHPPLDEGERDLLVYAVQLGSEAWLLNSPDMAVVRFAHQVGWLDRLVSLEAMTRRLKLRPCRALAQNYTEPWLSQRKTQLRLGA